MVESNSDPRDMPGLCRRRGVQRGVVADAPDRDHQGCCGRA